MLSLGWLLVLLVVTASLVPYLLVPHEAHQSHDKFCMPLEVALHVLLHTMPPCRQVFNRLSTMLASTIFQRLP